MAVYEAKRGGRLPQKMSLKFEPQNKKGNIKAKTKKKYLNSKRISQMLMQMIFFSKLKVL